MKKLFPQISSVLLAIVLATQAWAQAPSKPAADITWTFGESRELTNLRGQLEVIKQRDLPPAETAALKKQIEFLEARQQILLSFDFRGGSIKQFLALLAKVNVVSLNVITSNPADLEVELPPLSLRNASTNTIIGVLGNLLDPRGYNLRYIDDSREGNAAVCVLTKRPGAVVETQVRPTVFESFPVGQYLSEQSIDDIVGAIRAGWELDPAHDKDALKLKFHQPTSILLVSGPPEATFISGKIISQLKRPPAKVVKVNAQGEPLPEMKK
jgi:hypothetical protein